MAGCISAIIAFDSIRCLHSGTQNRKDLDPNGWLGIQ